MTTIDHALTYPGWETRLVHGLIDYYLETSTDHDDTLAAILDLLEPDVAVHQLAAHPHITAGEVLWTLVSYFEDEPEDSAPAS
ncbi:hypothetical protein [Stomatohabitans albus]|uniref:hypothetical protein n=1 Tax=Stomatohabitans albus TaxID=3110766 RepID=UPI00300DABB4